MPQTSENIRQSEVTSANIFEKLKFAGQVHAVYFWLAVFALIGVALTLLYHDAEQQDSAYHFLFARWAWEHPVYFVSVWARPLFTLVYFPASQLGYPAAKLFTVFLSLAAAWQTFRLAKQLGFRRAALAVPFLFLQPAFFALSSVVMTETLFALLFAVALRLHLSGRVKSGMLVASTLILVRPEGFFIGTLWGIWFLFGVQSSGENPITQFLNLRSTGRLKALLKPPIQSLLPLLLASGMFVWWLAAYWLTGDKLWIVHNWPSDWRMDGQANGTGPIWWYAAQLPLIAGLPLTVPFLAGLWQLIQQREFICGTSSFLTLFVLHSIMFTGGWFGSAGYARYFVCVSPVIALITIAGWNRLADWGDAKGIRNLRHLGTLALVLSALACFVYIDAVRFTRDARAVDAMSAWLHIHHPELFEPDSGRISRVICSQAYTRILLDRDPWEKPSFTANQDDNVKLLRQSPVGTLVLWDEETGPKWYRLQAKDFEAAGYERLNSQDFKLEGWFVRLKWNRIGGPRLQRMHWFYKSSDALPIPGH